MTVPLQLKRRANTMLRARRSIFGLIALALAPAAMAVAPANDNFANRALIAPAGNSINGTNVEATKEVGEPNHVSSNGQKSVWWSWTPSADASVTVDTIGSDYDTVLAVYTGNSVNGLTLVASNDDALGALTSRTAFVATAGVTYQIVVDGSANASGSIVLTVQPGGPPPANDSFAGRIAVAPAGATVAGTSTAATREIGEPMHGGNEGGRSVWWSWTPVADTGVTIHTNGSGFDTILAVYSGGTLAALSQVAFNDDDLGSPPTSRVSFNAVGGTTYQIAVDGYEGDSGSISLTVEPGAAVAPPNDHFAFRTPITGVGDTVTGSNIGGSKETGEPSHAGNAGGKSVWWTWTATSTGTFSVSTADSSFDTLLAVYTGSSVDALSSVASNDNNGGSATSRLQFPATAGIAYQIAVDGKGGASGTISLVVEVYVPPTPPAITSHPANKTAVIGSDVTFSATATGTAPLSYQWKRNGSNVGTNSPTLTVTDVQPGAGATYTVVVTNSAGSVTSNPATLALDATPRLINVSCLASSGSGDSTLVAGFYINGAGSKTLLIRGIGPRLTSDPFNRTGVVADPQIRVYDKDGVLIASNDNWDPILAADFSRMGAFGLTNGSLDAALKVTLPGNDRYTVHLVNNGPIADGLIEIYDFSRDNATRLSNVSCRLDLKANETVILGTSLIANPVPVLARAIGPGLADYGIPLADVLPDPDVRVYAGPAEIAFNEDWSTSVQTYFGPAGAFPLTVGSKDAVARVNFTQGGLTIHATGKGQTGIAIIELFESPAP